MARSLIISCCLLMAILLTLAASTGSAGGHRGHLDVNVWRGPSKGYKKHKFAPWGYYAKLPADEAKKKKNFHHYG